MRKKTPLIIVLVIAIFTAWPLLTRGFIPTHDGEYHLIRFWQFDKNIQAGVFLPRWASDLNHGFGVPIFNFFYPLPDYIAEFFHLVLCFSFVESFKLTMALGIIFGALFFYLWLREFFDDWSAAVGAIFYTLAPYHLLDVYVRGSIGEVLALALFPAVLWLIERKSWLAPIFIALLILSHNLLALLFMYFLISYLFFRKLINRYSLIALFFGFGLAAFFWLPALVEAKYVTGLEMINLADHFPDLSQLILPSWGEGFSVPGIGDQISFQVGIPHLLVVLAGWSASFFLAWFGGLFFLLLEVSLPFWKIIPGLSLSQYPWRLLSLTILVTSFLAGYLSSIRKSRLWSIGLIILALVFYSGYARPIKYAERTDDFYLSNPNWTQGTATLGNSFKTKWLLTNSDFKNGEELQIISPIHYRFQKELSEPEKVQVNVAYFPGWQVLVNKKAAEIDFQNGLINFELPVGHHEVEIKFRPTPIRRLAETVSLVSLLLLIVKVIFKKPKDEKKSRH